VKSIDDAPNSRCCESVAHPAAAADHSDASDLIAVNTGGVVDQDVLDHPPTPSVRFDREHLSFVASFLGIPLSNCKNQGQIPRFLISKQSANVVDEMRTRGPQVHSAG